MRQTEVETHVVVLFLMQQETLFILEIIKKNAYTIPCQFENKQGYIGGRREGERERE